MTPRSLILFLFSLPALAQQANNEIAISYGRSNFAQRGNSPTIGLSYAHFWSNSLGARIGIHRSEKDFPDNQGHQNIGAYYATVEYHLFRDRLFSPYVGAGIAYGVARIDSTPSGFTAEDTTVSVIGDVGVDVNLPRSFAIAANLSYMKFDPNLGDRHGSALHPMTMLVSAKYRF
jgi:outer membrane protein W